LEVYRKYVGVTIEIGFIVGEILKNAVREWWVKRVLNENEWGLMLIGYIGCSFKKSEWRNWEVEAINLNEKLREWAVKINRWHCWQLLELRKWVGKESVLLNEWKLAIKFSDDGAMQELLWMNT
jgi:hypothetical protein